MIKKKKPLVSICIPTYNGVEFLSEAVESALNQTYSNVEIVVSDDNSKDKTLDVIRNYKRTRKIPIKILNHTPIGIGANWNNCIKHAKGKYIKFLFQDDILESHCITNMVGLAEQIENLGLVYCKRVILYDDANNFDRRWVSNFSILHKSWDGLKIKQGTLSGREYIKDKNLLLHPVNKIGEPTAVLIRKKCFDKVGYFSERLDQALDIEFWYRLMPHYNIGFIDEPLVNFRLHSNQASQINAKKNLKDKESKILDGIIMRRYFWYLHFSVRLNLLKSFLYFDKIQRFFKKAKAKLMSSTNG
tara:strand:+ start:9588 stop:10493 length:906 start_codon:yes stop_codon:yes gene_type:complete